METMHKDVNNNNTKARDRDEKERMHTIETKLLVYKNQVADQYP